MRKLYFWASTPWVFYELTWKKIRTCSQVHSYDRIVLKYDICDVLRSPIGLKSYWVQFVTLTPSEIKMKNGSNPKNSLKLQIDKRAKLCIEKQSIDSIIVITIRYRCLF